MMNKLFKNWPFKLLAVLLAVIVWYVIMNLADPNQTRTINNIPIQVINDSTLVENRKAVTVEGSQYTSIRVNAPSSVVRALSVSDFTAVADLENLYDATGQVPIKISWRAETGLTASQVTQLDPSLKVKVEDILSKRLAISVETVGELPEGYYLGSTESIPRYVTITAPESVLQRIAEVKTAVDISELTESAEYSGCTLDFYSEAGNLLNLSGAQHTSFSVESVNSRVEILTMKTVPVVIAGVSGQEYVQEGYRYVNSKQSLNGVQLSGLKSRLASLSVISIPEELLSVSGASEDVTYEIDLLPFLPEGISLINSEEAVLKVTLIIEPLATREIAISDVTIVGQNGVFEYECADATVTVKLRAAEDDFSGLDPKSVSITVNAADLGPGEYDLPALVTCSDSVFEPVGEVTVKIIINDPTPPTTEEPTTEEETEPETDEEGNPIEVTEEETSEETGN